MSVTETVRYTFRLRPGVLAERALLAEWGRCRWLWNEAVHQQKTRRKPTICKLSKLLTAARAEFVWLRDGSQNAQQQMLRRYAVALERSFEIKSQGRPKLKHRKTALPSLGYTARSFTIRDGRLTLPKGVSIPVVWSRKLPGAPSSVRVYRDSLGHWYASFVVTREPGPAPEADRSIGIDWGVATTATATDPAYDLPYGGYRKRCAAELAKAQRKMARRRKRGHAQSGGYRRAKRDAADAAIGAAKRGLIERGMRAGRKVVLVPPAYTTMTCSECGERQARLGLGERIFRCADCGYTAGRDRNAARVILAMAERGHAGADDVRHPSRALPGAQAECGPSQKSPGLSRGEALSAHASY